MKALTVYFSFLTLIVYTSSCSTRDSDFNPDTIRPLIQQAGKKWSEGTRTANLEVIASIYAPNGHYIPDRAHSQHGTQEIKKFWAETLPVIKDIQLNMETLEGTEEIVYETGLGYALLASPEAKLDTFRFKYVNVWRLQENGEYKCVVDVYNNLP